MTDFVIPISELSTKLLEIGMFGVIMVCLYGLFLCLFVCCSTF